MAEKEAAGASPAPANNVDHRSAVEPISHRRSWAKVWRRLLHNRTIRRAKVEFKWLWVSLILLPDTIDGRLVADGIPYTVEDIADAVNLPVEVTADGLSYYLSARMLARDPDGCYRIVKYADYQECPSAARMRRYRARHSDGKGDGNSGDQRDGARDDRSRSRGRGRGRGENHTHIPTLQTEGTGEELIPPSAAHDDSDFEAFWAAYPKRKSRADAKKAWVQTANSRPPVELILAKIDALKETRQWEKDGGQYIPHPATWLRGGGWDDEITPSTSNVHPFESRKDPWHPDDVAKYGGTDGSSPHQMWDRYFEAHEDLEGPWERFDEWLAKQNLVPNAAEGCRDGQAEILRREPAVTP